MPRTTIDQRWRWWNEDLGSPRYILAPMVLQSELAYRMQVRRYGVDVCYAPMLPVEAFLASSADGQPCENPLTGGPSTRASWFTTAPGDRPLFAQLGGGDPEQMLKAALLVQDSVDAVDVNFGCPQRCACVGGYGAFLLDDPARARAIIETLVRGLRVPVTAKIRILPTLEATLSFARMLEEAGVSALTVHGRLREQRHHEGPADWGAIAAVKAALSIPVIANGNVRKKGDADACMRETGVDGVMSATALLSNPRLFGSASELPATDLVRAGGRSLVRDGRPTACGRRDMALEYLECCRRWPDGALPRMISDHLLALLRVDLDDAGNSDLKKRCKDYRRTVEPHQFAAIVQELAARHVGATDSPAASPSNAGNVTSTVAAVDVDEESRHRSSMDAVEKAVKRSARRRRRSASSSGTGWLAACAR